MCSISIPINAIILFIQTDRSIASSHMMLTLGGLLKVNGLRGGERDAVPLPDRLSLEKRVIVARGAWSCGVYGERVRRLAVSK